LKTRSDVTRGLWISAVRESKSVAAGFEFLMASSLAAGVIERVAVLQTERRIFRSDAVCRGRSLGPLVKTRALRDDALRDSDFI
jgi:hypothetical protein